MMAYIVWYFAAGASALGLYYIFVARKRARENVGLGAGFAAGGSDRESLWDKFLNWFLFPLIAFAIYLVIWPWMLWIEARRALARKNDRAKALARKFVVRDEFLICELPLGDIESRETVEDPLGAAPRVPFGHMNPAWEVFKASGENGTFWTFSGKYVGLFLELETEWLYEGYAVLKEDGTRPYFLTHLERLGWITGSEKA